MPETDAAECLRRGLCKDQVDGLICECRNGVTQGSDLYRKDFSWLDPREMLIGVKKSEKTKFMATIALS